MTLHSSMIFKVFQLTSLPRFGYILSPKKDPEMFKIVAERVLNVSGKLYTNVLNHTARKNNILIILS